MIENWRLQNFKSVYEKTDLDLKPLTVFAGANSSGKSTFIQSMLLVTQTLTNQVYSRPVILNGHIMRLGSFDDLASSGSGCGEITIGFTLRPIYEDSDRLGVKRMGLERERILRRRGTRFSSLDCDFSFSAKGASTENKILQFQPNLRHCKLSVNEKDEERPVVVEFERCDGDIKGMRDSFVIPWKDNPDEIVRSLFYKVIKPERYPVGREYRYSIEEPQKGQLIGCKFSHFLPVGLSLGYDANEDHALQIFEAFRQARRYRLRVNFDEEDESFLNKEYLTRVYQIVSDHASHLPESYTEKRRALIKNIIQELSGNVVVDELLKLCNYIEPPELYELLGKNKVELIKLSVSDKQQQNAVTAIRLPRVVQEGGYFIRRFFSESFKYLGPLRDEPKAVYPVQGAVDPADVGLRGEFTAGVLDLYKNTDVKYIPSSFFTEGGTKWDVVSIQLRDAVLDWLKYMSVVERIQTQDLGIHGHELKVGTDFGDTLHNLMHVGFGVSQVLPILVMSILAETKSVLVFEQPEIHLHPKVQARLADFLLSMALMGKQCIVETHSEYLINRLRLRAAVDTENKVSEKMGIYFVEKHNGRSEYRRVEVNEYGAIVEWPEGFFDQSQEDSERILRAAMEKKRRRKKEDGNG